MVWKKVPFFLVYVLRKKVPQIIHQNPWEIKMDAILRKIKVLTGNEYKTTEKNQFQKLNYRLVTLEKV